MKLNSLKYETRKALADGSIEWSCLSAEPDVIRRETRLVFPDREERKEESGILGDVLFRNLQIRFGDGLLERELPEQTHPSKSAADDFARRLTLRGESRTLCLQDDALSPYAEDLENLEFTAKFCIPAPPFYPNVYTQAQPPFPYMGYAGPMFYQPNLMQTSHFCQPAAFAPVQQPAAATARTVEEGSVVCPSCKNTVPGNARFCPECGAILPQT